MDIIVKLRLLLEKADIKDVQDLKKYAGPFGISLALLVAVSVLGFGGIIILSLISMLGFIAWFAWRDISSEPPIPPPVSIGELEDGKPFSRIRFTATRQGISYVFASRERLIDWLEDTQKAWRELENTASSAGLPRLAKHANNSARLVKEVTNDVLRNSFSLLKFYEKSCQDEKLISSGGTHGQYVFDTSFPIQNRAFAVAVFADASNLDPSFGTDPANLPLSAAELLNEFHAVFPEFRSKGGDAQVLFDVTVRALGRQQEASLHLLRQREQFESYLEAAEVRSQLGPAAARWRSKARWHALGVCIGIAPFILLLVLPIVFYNEIGKFSYQLWAMDQETEAHLKAWGEFFAKAPIAATLFLTVPMLLFAWVLRHFSRLFVRNLNLAADAGNRAAMADVYSRMIAQGAGFTPEQQTIIVQSLFASQSDDRHTDGVPSNALEQILNLVKPKSSG
jgi:hypothetical protein